MALPFDTSVVCPVFIGRAAALASFERVFEQVKSGQGQMVLVSGEAGTGKSRLVAEAKASVGQERARFLQGACFEQDRALPFAPLLDMLRTLLVTGPRESSLPLLVPLAPELIKILPDLALWLPDVTPTPALEPEQEQRRLFVTLTHFLLGLCDQRPVVLVIEDLHWSDDVSLEFLLYLSRYLKARPLLLLLTYRSEEVSPLLHHFLATLNRERAAVEFSLVNLTVDEVQAMVRTIFQLKRPVRRDFLEALYQLTEGNPFFVEEVLKSLLVAGDIYFTGSIWDRKELRELHIPRSVSDAVQQRISLLSDAARETLAVAAVGGLHVDFALLQALTGHPEHELMQCIEPLIAAQLLVETSAGQFAFRHALTQQAVYQGLLARKRKALHLTTAQMMEHLYAPTLEAHIAELAYHFYQAEAWTQALEYARRVGEKALALYAPRAALEHYTHALEAATHLPEVGLIPLYRTRGQAYGYLGNFEVARSDLEQAVYLARATEDRQEEWQSLMGLIWLLSEHDDQVRSDFFQRLLDLAQSLEDPQKYALGKNLQAHHLAYAGQPEASITMHEEALHLFQQQGDQRGEARALEFLGQTIAFYGDMRWAVSYYDRAIALSRSIGEKRICAASLAFRSYAMSPALKEPAFSAQGTLAACQRDLEEARSMADEMEWTVGQSFCHLNASWVFTSYGRLGEGFTHARAAREIATEIENPQWMVASCCVLGETYLVLLDPSQALAALEAGLAIVLTMGSVYWTGNIRVALARASLLAGDFPRTEATLEQIIAQDRAPHTILERRAAWVRGELALAQRRPDVALRLADALIASAPGEAQRAEGQPIPALLKLRGEALYALGQLEEALSALEEARRGAQVEGALPLLWQIHRSLGRVYAAAKQKQCAHQAFAAAREVIESLAASLDETELRERFLQAALSSMPKEQPRTPRQSATHAFGGLSEREREIAQLIAQGRSNREIAAAFSISERTVETHLGRMYAKLGLGTRAQLAAWVVEKGLALPPIS